MGIWDYVYLSREEYNPEADLEPDTKREMEVEVLGRLLDFSQLKLAGKATKIEQWSVHVEKTDENAGSGKVRVRKITDRRGRIKYELTTKSPVKHGNIETTVETNEVNFKQLKVMATEGMYKHRYEYPVKGTGLAWCVDVFPDGNGGYKPWFIAECELKRSDQEIPEFPLKTEEIYLPPEMNSKNTEDAFNSKKRELMEQFFISKNIYVTKQDVDDKTVLTGRDTEGDDDEPLEGNESQDEVQKEGVREVNGDSTTGDEKLSVSNITDDDEQRDKVMARAHQIVSRQEPEEPLGGDDEEDDFGSSDDDDSDEDSDDEDSEGGGDSEGGDEDSEGDDGGDGEGESDEGSEDEVTEGGNESRKISVSNENKVYSLTLNKDVIESMLNNEGLK